MWEHHKRVDARLISSVMGRTMPEGHTLRPLDRMASYRQQKALRFPPSSHGSTGPDGGQQRSRAITWSTLGL
jgi:hypothetical protein